MVELRKPCEHGIYWSEPSCPGATEPTVAEVIEWLKERDAIKWAPCPVCEGWSDQCQMSHDGKGRAVWFVGDLCAVDAALEVTE